MTNPQYSYSRGTDGCDNTFDIYDPAGEFLVSIHFWEQEQRARADAELIVHRLNLHEKLLAALHDAEELIRELFDDLCDEPEEDIAGQRTLKTIRAAIAAAEATEP